MAGDVLSHSIQGLACFHGLNRPKHEIFGSGVFTQIRPVREGDQGTRKKKSLILVGLGLEIAILYFLALCISLRKCKHCRWHRWILLLELVLKQWTLLSIILSAFGGWRKLCFAKKRTNFLNFIYMLRACLVPSWAQQMKAPHLEWASPLYWRKHNLI